MTANAADTYDIKPADLSLDFFFYRNYFKNFFVGNQNRNLRTDFCFYDRKLCSAHKLGSLVNDHLRKSGLF